MGLRRSLTSEPPASQVNMPRLSEMLLALFTIVFITFTISLDAVSGGPLPGPGYYEQKSEIFYSYILANLYFY